MTSRASLRRAVLLAAAAAALVSSIAPVSTARAPLQRKESGWQLPPEALRLQNPLPQNDALRGAGRKIFLDKCRKCHGAQGLGDGPDADPEYADSMNLTNPVRANRNPDGIVFFKVANGRSNPKMPAFRDELSEEQIWTVVAYVQGLRKK